MFEFSGIGLHSGNECRVRVTPNPTSNCHTINGLKVLPREVSQTQNRTVLCGVQTVEHLLAALTMSYFPFCDIEVEGGEIPILDGSARKFYDAFVASDYSFSRDPTRVFGSLYQHDSLYGNSRVSFSNHIKHTPSTFIEIVLTGFSKKLTIQINPQIPSRRVYVFFTDKSGDHTSYSHELLAYAKTYGNPADLKKLNDSGLALGASELNVRPIVDLDTECLLHKALDVLGDLSVLGQIPQGKYKLINPSHTANYKLVCALFEQFGSN